jgi:hypothetical protein
MSEYMEKFTVSRLIGALRDMLDMKKVASLQKKFVANLIVLSCWMKLRKPPGYYNILLQVWMMGN